MPLLRKITGRLALALSFFCSGCAMLTSGTTPIATERYAGSPGSDTLLVFLPGIEDEAADFRRRGFVHMARQAGVDADIVLADAHFGYYTSRTIVNRLEQDVIGPARARGYRHIWLVGISLGGLGSFLYAMDHPEQIDGIVALAPFLGSESYLRTLAAAGTDRAEEISSERAAGFEPQLWTWLNGYRSRPEVRPRVILAYGAEDRYGRGHRLLAQLLPGSQVISAPGAHHWSTWEQLWQQVLERPDFAPTDFRHAAERSTAATVR